MFQKSFNPGTVQCPVITSMEHYWWKYLYSDIDWCIQSFECKLWNCM